MNRGLYIITASCCTAAGVVSAADHVDYVKQLKHLLVTECYACHGALQQESGLRLETRGLMLRGGDSGSALLAVPREPGTGTG
ncbi:MAG: c-type cytochrome domain-containing protein [Planctomycetota bacterium]|nr:c-type cytochrome domain-containing protein [Planctomycetota bacterium]